jgi:hypothetical protein
VLTVDASDPDGPRTFEISRDLLLATGMRNDPSFSNQARWAPIFCPREFVETHQYIRVEDFELGRDDLLALGRRVTRLRLKFRQQAVEKILPRVGER